MFAVLSTAWVVPGIIGPAISGFIAEHASWRLVFLGLLPLVALAALLTIPAIARAVPDRHLGVQRPERASGSVIAGRRCRGRLLLAGGAGLLVVGLTDASLFPGVVLLVARRGRRRAGLPRLTPDGTPTARRGLPAAILIRGLLTFAFFSVDAYVPLVLIGWRGIDAAPRRASP